MTRRRIQAVGFLLGLAGLVIAVATTKDDIEGAVRPSALAFGVAGVAAAVSLLAAGRSWATLLDAGSERRSVLGALYLSQLSKYLPAGGLVQAAGQVSMSTTSTIPIRRAAVAYPIAVLEVVVAGSLLTVGLAVEPALSGWVRVLAGVAPLTVLTLHPRALRSVLTLGRRITSRLPDADHLPVLTTVARSWAWALINMSATTVAFVALLRSLEPDVALISSGSAFAAAWVIGFLVVPIPSGLGVREAVLVAAVPGLGAGTVLAASLAHRIVTLAAEIVITAGNAAIRRAGDRSQETPRAAS